MAEEVFKPKRLTMKSTKQEMLQTYKEVLAELEAKQEVQLKPEIVLEEKKTQEAIEVTDSLSTDGIVQEITGVRLEVGKLLSEVSDRLEEEVNKYRQVKVAVKAKEKDLEEIYGIEKAALSLAALIDAQNQRRQETDAEIETMRSELTTEISALRAEWEDEKHSTVAQIKERDAADKKQREREKEEYKYAFEREQQLAREKFSDELARLEREVELRRDEMERDLVERERAIAETENELNVLRDRATAFPKELDKTVKETVADAVARVELEAQNREELLKKEFEGERNVLNTRIVGLEKSVKEQQQQLAKLTQQAEKAYVQVQDIAVKAIEGTSRAQVVAGMQQLSSEPARKDSSD